jgi:hypothetical protein
MTAVLNPAAEEVIAELPSPGVEQADTANVFVSTE